MAGPPLFPETRWSLVLDAQGAGETRARRALGELCQGYWYPLYAFARRKGLSPHDAEDRIQSFFQHLLEKGALELADRDQGKLRAFLLASPKNFLAKQWRDESTRKRGGDAAHLFIDTDAAEQQFLLGGGSDAAPESFFDRSWAYALLQSVFTRLEQHYERVRRRELYDALRPALQGDGRYGDGDALAKRFGLSPEGLRSAVFKLRRRFRDYVEEEVRDTCASPDDANDEIRHLCRILAAQ